MAKPKEKPTHSQKEHYPIENAMSFLVLGCTLMFLFLKFAVAAFETDGTKNMNFLCMFSNSRIEDISADWIVFLLIISHIIRVKFGIAFLKYDKSYLLAGKELGLGKKELQVRNYFILFNLLAALILSYYITAENSTLLIISTIFCQAIIMLYYDWYTRKQLFEHEKNKKANFLIIIGDVSYFIFAMCILLYYIFVTPSPNGLGKFLLGYFCLISFAVFELLTIVLVVESLFTYREGLKLAWKDFKKVLIAG